VQIGQFWEDREKTRVESRTGTGLQEMKFEGAGTEEDAIILD
jgi:hypothetical protein